MIIRSLHSWSFHMKVYETHRRLVPKFGMKWPLVLDPLYKFEHNSVKPLFVRARF